MNLGAGAASQFKADLRDLDRGPWLDELKRVSDRFGHFTPLSDRHSAIYINGSDKLIVSFETIQSMRQHNPDEEPRTWRQVRDAGWSSLTLMSDGETWFRDPGVYGYFDKLIDADFFDDFETILFTGTHSCGYAAAAYSVAAPGSRVLALRPQATLSPDKAGWDDRFMRMRRTSFTDRYGYAPDMIDGAMAGWIVFDPSEPLDAMHATLFDHLPHVTLLQAPRIGERVDREFDVMGILDPLIEAAMDGSLDREYFAKLYRARRTHLRYLRNTLQELEDNDRLPLAAMLCRHVLADRNRPFFQRKLQAYRDRGIGSDRTDVAQPA